MILTSLIQGYRDNLMSVLFGKILARLVLLSVIVGSISSIVGIFVSGFFKFACDPSIILVQFVVLMAVFGWISKKVCPTLIHIRANSSFTPIPLHGSDVRTFGEAIS